jgi:hypothetical protein
MNLYVASSWRNATQPSVVQALREAHHQVYDFRAPAPGVPGFAWSDIDPHWQSWTPDEFRAGLQHPVAQRGFHRDYYAMRKADACVLVCPCGRSAHLEAGWFMGAGRPVWILVSDDEPELMYLLAGSPAWICASTEDIVAAIDAYYGPMEATP